MKKRGTAILAGLVVIIGLFHACAGTPETQSAPDDGIDYIEPQIQNDIPPLKDVWESSFPIGSAVEPYQFIGEEGVLLARHFNSITAENVMKQLSIHPEPDKFKFGPADSIVEFAEANEMLVRGHTLVWHHEAEMADWMFADEAGNPHSRETMLTMLEKHISTVVSRYKGRIYCWDVVNEAIDTNESDSLRHTPWYELIGPDYIKIAFEMAHKADPDALLFLNEYDTFNPAKRDALFNLVKELKDSGTPIDGVGLQMHLSVGFPKLDAIRETITLFRELGLQIHITELDMSLYAHEFETHDDGAPPHYLVHQAYRYKELFDLFKSNSDIITSVTFWGYNDAHSWLNTSPVERTDWPLLFDRNYQAKWAYWGLVDPSKLPEDEGLGLVSRDPYEFTAAKGTPVLDAEIDSLWEKAETVKTDIHIIGAENAIATVRALWDEENLYFLAEVKDSLLSDASGNNYEEDSLEIFVDEFNDKTETYGKDDGQYRVNFKGKRSSGGYAKQFQAQARVTDSGYIVEGAAPWLMLSPEAGMSVGFDIQVNDDKGNARREGLAKWNDPTNESWRNTSGWGILHLTE